MSHTPLIYLVPHFHYDPVWLEDQRTYTAQAFELVKQYVEAAQQDPSFKFVLSELDYLKPYWDAFLQQRAPLRQLVADGRVELNGGYNEPNETSIHGEAILRNLIYGRLFQRGVLGIAPRVYLPLDVFGHCPQLPQILRQLGFAACVFSKDIAGVAPLCRALALDGSEVIQKHEHYWFNPQSWEEFLENVFAGPQVNTGPQPSGLDIDLRFIGMDMAPPPKWLLGRGEELAQREPAMRVGLPEEYLGALEERLAAGATQLPISSRDLAMYHPGTTVSRIELKIANRLAENALFTAERFCSMAWLLGADYPHAALDKAWRLLMFGQHHDAITGTPCDISFLDLMAMYREALDIAERINNDVLDALAGVVETAPPRGEALSALVVFNPLSWQRTDVCRARIRFDPPVTGFALRDEGRKDVACQLVAERREGESIAEAEIAFIAHDVPALGYSVYHVVSAGNPPRGGERRETDRATIENEHYTISAAASAGGGIISILDRQAKRQVLELTRGLLGNELAVLGEQADRRQPAWTVFTTGEQAFTKDGTARLWVERGPAMQRIIAEGDAPDCAGRRQEIALYPGVPRIDFITDLRGYRGEHQLFVATFPLSLDGVMPVFEERFGAVARRRSAGCLAYQTFQGQSLSGCALLPAQNWMEAGNCLRVVAHRARGRAEAGFSIGWADIITGSGAASRRAGERLTRFLAAQGVTAAAFADDGDLEADRLNTTFRFSLSVGGDNAHAGRLLDACPANVREQADKATQRPGYAFVLTLDPPLDSRRLPTLLLVARDAEAVTAALDEFEKDAVDGVVSLPSQSNAVDEEHAPPEDYGVAVINRGNIGASLETDSTAALALMHTTAWPNHPWGEGKLETFFVPEHKDHRFCYALYPHRGDWRRGEVTRRGYEFNQPLVARQCAVQEASGGAAPGGLPPRQSFLSLEPSNVFLTALKPRGYPAAMGARREDGEANALIARFYEGHGQPARVEISGEPSIAQAWRSDPLESRGAPLPVERGRAALELRPYGIETVELKTERRSLLAGQRFGPEREVVQHSHMRYWEHNLGPAPMGNQPVTVMMEGAPPIGATTRFTLSVASAVVDAEATGMVRISVPEGWTITPKQVPFRLPPGGEQDYELAVIIPADAKPSYIRAEVEIGGQVYQEVLPVGEMKPVIASFRRVEDRLEVTVRNPNTDRVQGRVDIVTPLETWGGVVGEFAQASVHPAAQGFDLEPGAECILAFEIRGAGMHSLPEVTHEGAEDEAAPSASDFWAFARVACHGDVQYLRAK